MHPGTKHDKNKQGNKIKKKYKLWRQPIEIMLETFNIGR